MAKRHSDSHFFIHIPKNAGNSIAKTLEGSEYVDKDKHQTQDYFLKKNPKLASLSFFCVVRNPYSRLVSAYNYYFVRKKGRSDMTMRQKGLSKSKVKFEINTDDIESFEQFVRGEWYLGWGCLEKSCSDYFSSSVPMHALYFEDLENSYSSYLNSPVRLEKLNSSTGNDWSEYYTDELAEIVYNKHREDFDRFSYDRNSWIQRKSRPLNNEK